MIASDPQKMPFASLFLVGENGLSQSFHPICEEA